MYLHHYLYGSAIEGLADGRVGNFRGLLGAVAVILNQMM